MKQFVFISAILLCCILFTRVTGVEAFESESFPQFIPEQKNTTINSFIMPQSGYFASTYNSNSSQINREDSMWVFAGNDTIVCLNNQWVTLNGSASDYWYSLWSTTGDGFFSDANALITNYFPGTNDLLNGQVRLLLSVYGEPPEFQYMTDTVNVGMVKAPFSNAGPDFVICENESFLNLSAQVSNYSSFMWSTTGDGSFINPTQLETTYIPGQNDIAEGSAILCIVVMPNSPCMMPSVNCMTLYIEKIPFVENLPDTATCSGNSLRLTPTVYHCDSVYWSTLGDGYFSNQTTPETRYYPGAIDIVNGQVELQLSITSGCICNQVVVNSMILTIHPHPQIFSGENQTVCIGDTIRLAGEGQNYSSIEWYSYGDGCFDNRTILNPNYFPGDLDNERGWVFLEILANAFEPCNFFIGSYIQVVILGNPEANAGADSTICINEVFKLQADAINFSSLLWTSSGDGSFTNPTGLITDYLPGEADMAIGSVTLTLTLQPEYPCFMTAQDELVLTLAQSPVILAGPDQSGCNQIQLNLTGQNYESLIWTTSGDGYFSNQSISDPLYFAGVDDLNAGFVQLTATGFPFLPCLLSHSDEMIFFIDNPQILSETIEDQLIYAGESLEMEFFVQSYSAGNFSWFHNDLLIANSNSPTLSLTGISKVNAGTYHCEFTNDCETILSSAGLLSVLEPETQILQIPEGWSSLSSFVSPSDPSVSSIFAPISNQLVVVYNFDGAYWPAANLNTLIHWDTETGYSIKMETAVVMEISGVVKYPFDPVLVAPGWSFLPVKSICMVNVEETFGGYPEIVMIKEVSGTKLFWPEMQINTLEYIIPGKSYLILNSGEVFLELTIPECED